MFLVLKCLETKNNCPEKYEVEVTYKEQGLRFLGFFLHRVQRRFEGIDNNGTAGYLGVGSIPLH